MEKQPDLSVKPTRALSSCVTPSIDFNFSEAPIPSRDSDAFLTPLL